MYNEKVQNSYFKPVNRAYTPMQISFKPNKKEVDLNNTWF